MDKCKYLGCYEKRHGDLTMCEEHDELIKAVTEDIVNLNYTEEQIVKDLKRLSNETKGYITKYSFKSVTLNARSPWEMLVKLYEMGELDIPEPKDILDNYIPDAKDLKEMVLICILKKIA